jgi:RNA polymerase sigma-70 factor (ECF subfamily)
MHRRAELLTGSSIQLLQRSRAGDRHARDLLFDRYMPMLRRWARGRLPAWARDLNDTEDAIQDAVLRTLERIGAVDLPDTGALHAYLRQAVLNRIRDEMRRIGRRPPVDGLAEHVPDSGLSPLEATIGALALERYEAALQRVSAEDRELVIARVELGRPYAEIAAHFDKPSANAARMAVARAIARLAAEMRRAR